MKKLLKKKEIFNLLSFISRSYLNIKYEKAPTVKARNFCTVAMDHRTNFSIPHLLSIFSLLYFLYLLSLETLDVVVSWPYLITISLRNNFFSRSLFKKERKWILSMVIHIGFSFHFFVCANH